VRIDAAESIWGPESVERLISLAEKSLLRRREDPDGQLRLWMLETVRQFALERAAEDDPAGEAVERHAAHFLALAERAAPHLHGPEERLWLDRLESEQANLRVALDHLTAEAPSRAVQMAGALVWFWEIRGYRIEGRPRLTRVLASAPADDPGRGRALVAAGRMAQRAGQLAEATSLLLEALPIVRRQGEQRLTALALVSLGWVEGMLGNDAGLAERFEEAIATARAAGDDWALAQALNSYSACPGVDRDRARAMAEQGLSLFRRVRDPAGTAITAGTVAEVALDAGELDTAEKLINESLEGAREVGFRSVITYGLVHRSIVALFRDDADRADADLRAAIQTYAPYDDSDWAAVTLSAAATISAIRQAPMRAAMLWAAADTARGSTHEHTFVARLRATWQVQARAQAGDQAAWDAAERSGADLALEDALALAVRTDEGREGARPALR
jgi:tetratricopeptide (TPR) repeat protein